MVSSYPPTASKRSRRKKLIHSMQVVHTLARLRGCAAVSKRPLMLRPLSSAARPVTMSHLLRLKTAQRPWQGATADTSSRRQEMRRAAARPAPAYISAPTDPALARRADVHHGEPPLSRGKDLGQALVVILIDNDDLEVLQRLALEAVEQTRQRVAAGKRRDDQGEGGMRSLHGQAPVRGLVRKSMPLSDARRRPGFAIISMSWRHRQFSILHINPNGGAIAMLGKRPMANLNRLKATRRSP